MIDETTMIDLGAKRFQRNLENAAKQGRATDVSPAGKGLVSHTTTTTLTALEAELCLKGPKGIPGPRYGSLSLIRAAECAPKAAFIASKVCVEALGYATNNGGEPASLATTAHTIGKLIDDELMVEA